MSIVTRDRVDGKICTKCKEWKPVAEFHRRSASRDGYQYTCKICSNLAVKDHYQRNLEREREKDRVYRETNRQKIREYDRLYGAKYREQRREYGRKYREANPRRESRRVRSWQKANPAKIGRYKRTHRATHREAIRAQQRKWTAANPDKVGAKRHRRRTREIDNGGSFSSAEWAALKARYGYTCLRCGKREPEITLTPDHIVPVVNGGSSDISNIQPLCGPCNSAKGANSTDYRHGWAAGSHTS
jgi:5-methylcytosine-specific restriction endonuclease McrA